MLESCEIERENTKLGKLVLQFVKRLKNKALIERRRRRQ